MFPFRFSHFYRLIENYQVLKEFWSDFIGYGSFEKSIRNFHAQLDAIDFQDYQSLRLKISEFNLQFQDQEELNSKEKAKIEELTQ
jgi:hypothetical protein